MMKKMITLALAAIMLLTLLIGLIPTKASAAKLTSEKLEGLKNQIAELEKIIEEQKKQASANALNAQPGLSTGKSLTGEEAQKAQDAQINKWFGLK